MTGSLSSRIIIVFMLMFIIVNVICQAATPVSDPGILDGESIVYTITIDKASHSIVQTTAVKNPGERKVYEISISSPVEDQVVRMDAQNMAVIHSDVTRKHEKTTVRTVTSVIKNDASGNDDELIVLDFSGLQHVLRGFPFGNKKSIKIKNAENNGFTLVVTMVEKVKIKIKSGDAYDCFRLDLAVEGFWGIFASKTSLWYTADPPHYLVRSEGPSGPPGSPMSVLEIVEYIAGNHADPKD